MKCPLRVCIGASNSLPEEESLAAFADRFLVRCFLHPVSDSLLEEMLSGGREKVEFVGGGELSTLDELSRKAGEVELGEVRPLLAQAIRQLRHEGVNLSDRRSVRAQNLIAAAAAIAGREKAGAEDLWALVLAVPTEEEQKVARRCLTELLGESDNPALHHLAEEASAAPRVRARMLVEVAEKALAEPLDTLRVEGVLRDIDANFSEDDLPPELTEARARLKAALS